ncbi:MAG: ROK family protein [Planctomycetes bacterium]|nr:ROK family protein [Planctomycetota bacterium]
MITGDDLANDQRVVLTLDAGGTNFSFSAIRGGRPVGDALTLPAEPHDLDASLRNMVGGFQSLIDQTGQPPAAISFAFPGPADYPNGVIFNVGNLPAYRGGVAVGPMLAERFGVPVFLNNDGDLFAYGEAIAGLLPEVNRELAAAGSSRRYRNLVGLTLGTGLGGGIVVDGRLLTGDNSAGGEFWLLRNKVRNDCFAEEGASIRAVRSAYAEAAGVAADGLSPKDICDIATGQASGDPQAARRAFELLGEVVGDVLANVLTLIDGLAVIGGGLANAAPLFLPRVMAELNGTIASYGGGTTGRLVQEAYDLGNPAQRQEFFRGESRVIAVPHSSRTVLADPRKRIGVGISKLGANHAVAVGAYAFALSRL